MKKVGTFLLSIALIIGMMSTSANAAAATGFTDVQKTNQFHDEIQYLVNKKIISGFTDGTFKPKKNVTRGDAAIMIGRMLTLDGTQTDTKFKDVSKSYAGSGYIASAVKKGIIGGYTDGTFRPGNPISRGEMAIIVSRAFGLSIHPHYNFSDVNSSSAAYEAVSLLAGASISTGYPNGTFKPSAKVTREQFSAFLARGMSPVYKQKAAMPNGYAQDMTKQYTYAEPSGESFHTFKNVTNDGTGTKLGFVWEYTDSYSDDVVYYLQFENSEELALGIPQSHIYTDLKYPIKVNTSWYEGIDEKSKSKITKVNTPVKTLYKTFTSAVEVTTSDGYKLYYVKGIGEVKTIDSKGKTVRELKSLK